MSASRQAGALIVVTLLGLSACGGASHSASATRASAANTEQTRLLAQLRSELEAPGSSVATVRGLDECIVQQAEGLPLSGLRKLAGGHVGTADTDPLVARCFHAASGGAWR